MEPREEERHFDSLQRQKKLLKIKRKGEANRVCKKTKLRHYEGFNYMLLKFSFYFLQSLKS